MLSHEAKQINAAIALHSEWLFMSESKTQSLTRDEIEIKEELGKLILYFSSNEGYKFWRVMKWKQEGEKLSFEVSKNFGKEKTTIELIPRVSSQTLTANINESRQERAIKIASLAASLNPKTEIEKVGLSKGMKRGAVGRYARVVLKTFKDRIAVTADVSEDADTNIDAFFSSSLLWFSEQQERKKEANQLWLIEQSDTHGLTERIACLRPDLRRVISLYGIEGETLTQKSKLEIEDLWQTLPEKISTPSSNIISETAQNILSLAPDAIDVVRVRNGETLRYHGLPFCRIRKTMKRERVWFGTERDKRQELNPHTLSDFDKLISELITHRNADAEDKRHDFYRLASEAWLESILRRDITRLDPGLIIAPLHAQFRADNSRTSGARPVDLLALRQDGRLVVIELKTSEDREHIFQGVDYWRQIESHRRAGNIERAKLFGDKEISNEPPLVYLVAPMLSFHGKFQMFAKMLDPQIEIYRFDLNEDWRFGIRTARRLKVTDTGLQTTQQ
jgi:hypothetical protein